MAESDLPHFPKLQRNIRTRVLIYHKIWNKYGIDAARQYYEVQREALEHYRHLDGPVTGNMQ